LDKNNKFLFDLNNFDSDNEDENLILEPEDEILSEPEPPPPPTFSEDELDAAKAMAESAGRIDGAKQERDKREQEVADSLQKISNEFEKIFAAELYREKQYEEEVIRLSLALVDKLSPMIFKQFGKDDLKNTLLNTLKDLRENSEIIIEVHPDLATEITDYIDGIWLDPAQAPKYRIVGNNELTNGACDIKWQDGGMVRDPEKIAETIKAELVDLLSDDYLSPNALKTSTINDADVTKTQKNAIKESQAADLSDDEHPKTLNNGDTNE